jgi:hypothetical protein
MDAEMLGMAVSGGEADTLWTDFLRRRAWPRLRLEADRLGHRFLHAGRSRALVKAQCCRIPRDASRNTQCGQFAREASQQKRWLKKRSKQAWGCGNANDPAAMKDSAVDAATRSHRASPGANRRGQADAPSTL